MHIVVTGGSGKLGGAVVERLLASGFAVAAVDSSRPDVNDGHVGRDRYSWIREQYTEPDDIKIFVVHHHLVPIPGTGRERNIITDAGDLLADDAQDGFLARQVEPRDRLVEQQQVG